MKVSIEQSESLSPSHLSVRRPAAILRRGCLPHQRTGHWRCFWGTSATWLRRKAASVCGAWFRGLGGSGQQARDRDLESNGFSGHTVHNNTFPTEVHRRNEVGLGVQLGEPVKDALQPEGQLRILWTDRQMTVDRQTYTYR